MFRHRLGFRFAIVISALVCGAVLLTSRLGAIGNGSPSADAYFLFEDDHWPECATLMRMDLDGKGLVALTKVGKMNVQRFSVSNDGKQIVAYRNDSNNPVKFSNRSFEDIVIFDRDGRILRSIDISAIPLIWPNSPPMLLPDGNHIGFVAVQPISDELSHVQHASVTRIITTDLHGKDLKEIATIAYDCRSACWSPDGKTILYTNGTLVERPGSPYIVWRLWEMDANGKNPRPIAADNTWQGWFSPDCKRIAYISAGNKTWDLVLADADGSHPRTIVQFGTPLSSPRWLPDGKAIEFFKVDDVKIGYGSVWAIDLETARPRQISPKQSAACLDWRSSVP